MSVPVFQPDRFQVNAPAPPEYAQVGEEVSLSLSYVNKGKAEVSNVEAVIEGDVEALVKTQYLGNFESGKSGAIGFVFTPQTGGETAITLKISYEDANQEVKTLAFPLTLNVQEPIEEPIDPGLEQPDDSAQKSIRPWVLVAGGIGLLFLAAAVIKIIKKKKAAKAETASWDAWEEENEPITEEHVESTP